MIILIAQARCGSSRLPNKVLLPLNNKSIIQTICDRVSLSKYVDKTIIATSTNIEDDKIYNHCCQLNINCYRGDERDLINRFYYLYKLLNPEIIIRVTCDCPYLDYKILDKMIEQFRANKLDYFYNTDENDSNIIYPEGSDIEIFNGKVMNYIWKNEKEIREHVTGCIRLKLLEYSKVFNIGKFDCELNKLELKNNFNGIHLSIDKPQDYELAQFIFNNFKNSEYFSFEEILRFLDQNYEQYQYIKNSSNKNNTGQELYKKAKLMIPGGTQLLSKRPEMFLPENWPAYYSKVEGIEVSDLDGNKYLDMGINGVGSCILGAADKDVNNAVIECINRGSMSTLNHPNEVKLTEKLIELHPWANMARYTRASGEACAMAIRIARAYTGKYKVAFCGYHGWHDWYLATNINANGLDKHLLTGLSPEGVPPTLEGSIYPFNYNNFDELENLFKIHEIGVVIMEPMRGIYPENNFLHKVKELVNKHNGILIFDEVTSGFRLTNGGLHLSLGIEPDIAVFGKAISNGYPLGVVLGRKEPMQKAQETFISSTYWTEGIGFTAGLVTIEKFVRENVAANIRMKGEYFQTKLKELANKYDIKLTVSGLPSITAFSFSYPNPLAIKTLFNQEMLTKGYLSTLALYMTWAHTIKQIDNYLVAIENFVVKYKKHMEDNTIEQFLKGPIVHGGFQRLN